MTIGIVAEAAFGSQNDPGLTRRNITIAGLYVERWAPVIAAALQADPLAPPVGPEEEAVSREPAAATGTTTTATPWRS